MRYNKAMAEGDMRVIFARDAPGRSAGKFGVSSPSLAILSRQEAVTFLA
jgi:hypothetical protein